LLGILVIDKPLGITSHDVVGRVRRKFSTKRVGHAGTLDPLATGVLVVAVGPATRFLQYLPLEPKEYVFKVKFGIETTTQDAEGDIVAEKGVPENLLAEIERFLPDFRGSIQQIPPMYSAVKKDGKPLYALARKGETIERDPRNVFIYKYEIVQSDGDEVTFLCECSGGTYVRTLAHDMGQNVGCGAHVIELRRTRVGGFTIDCATQLEDATPLDLIQLKDALTDKQIIALNWETVTDAWNGNAIGVRPVPTDPYVALADPAGNVMGMARVTEHGFLQPECVIPREAFDAPV
jgi:tRNA pseudouridine55 synthase